MSKLRKVSKKELNERVEGHKRYIEAITTKIANDDYSSADTHNADLGYANLRGVDLAGANLSNTDLSTANLRYTDLRDANLYNTDLYGAYLKGAISNREVTLDE